MQGGCGGDEPLTAVAVGLWGDQSLSTDPEQDFLPGRYPGSWARGTEEGQGLLQRTAASPVSLVMGHTQSGRGLLCHCCSGGRLDQHRTTEENEGIHFLQFILLGTNLYPCYSFINTQGITMTRRPLAFWLEPLPRAFNFIKRFTYLVLNDWGLGLGSLVWL